jgi:ornithine cyclodeaminase/alanine dehydrogenase-like protein (mu-crystallin family)
MVLLLKEADVKAVLTMEVALEAVEEAFQGLADGSALNHSRRRLALDKGVVHYMASAVRSRNALGMKVYPTFGGPVQFLVPLYDATTGRMLALIEGDWLGQARTGAASGVDP